MRESAVIAAVLLMVSVAIPARAGDREDCRWPEPAKSLLNTDPDRVVSACHRLADQGYAWAQGYFGFLYDSGQGVPQDYVEAAQWYRKAADQGYPLAQYSLGLMYHAGQGVPQDYSEALRWYRKAADQGYMPAQYNLGLMYDNGEGVLQDYVHAHMWWNLAAARGNAVAAQNRDFVATLMTPSQIELAQRLAAAWRPTNQGNPWNRDYSNGIETGMGYGLFWGLLVFLLLRKRSGWLTVAVLTILIASFVAAALVPFWGLAFGGLAIGGAFGAWCARHDGCMEPTTG